MTEKHTPKNEWISDILSKTIWNAFGRVLWTEAYLPQIYMLQS